MRAVIGLCLPTRAVEHDHRLADGGKGAVNHVGLVAFHVGGGENAIFSRASESQEAVSDFNDGLKDMFSHRDVRDVRLGVVPRVGCAAPVRI